MTDDQNDGLWLSDYLELVRLPNVLTAMADVAMGLLFVWTVQPLDYWVLGLLLSSSALLYAAGIVLNDVYDIEIDRLERPLRPLPSGRISLGTARHLGWQLLVAGVLPAWIVMFRLGTFYPGLVAILLAGCIVLYDARLKRTLLGPVAMGACRMLNVLLGMSAAASAWGLSNWLVAGSIGLYVVGITWFARSEAGRSPRLQLLGGIVVMLCGVGLLASLPRWVDNFPPMNQLQPDRWTMTISVLGMLIGWQCLRAVIDPRPTQVQLAVKQCILSLVILDAAVVLAVHGFREAIAIVALLVPILLLGRLFSST